MKRLYKKSEIWFAVCWIILYVVGTSAADAASAALGVKKSVTLVLHIFLCAAVLRWLKEQELFEKYGLCKCSASPAAFLYYLPLAAVCSCNLWFGVKLNLSVVETVLYVLSMICVGFLEELIFRGFLFKAMSKDSVKSAVVVSSVTFGMGHIVNLINGSGADLLSNFLQVCYAVAFGFLFVIIFLRGKSLLPCVAAHSVINSLSVFAVEPGTAGRILSAVILTIIAAGYTLILLKTLPKEK